MRPLLSALFLSAGCLLSAAPQATAQTAAPTKQWDRTFSGNGNSYNVFASLQQTSDGGYLLGGTSDSGIGADKSQNGQGLRDYWVIKLDAGGNKQWDKTFGGTGNDELTVLQQTSDGGYLLGGFSDSGITGDKTQASRGRSDYWIVKLDASGTKQWDRTFGSNNADLLKCLQQTSDGGYLLGGEASFGISGDKTQAGQAIVDYWVVKLDASGTKQWDKTFGGSDFDYLRKLRQTNDGGYLLGGESHSSISGERTELNQGRSDYWIVKIDASGIKQWDRSFGGNSHDNLYDLAQTRDGGYVLGGWSRSSLSGAKSQNNKGNADYWVVKLDVNGIKQWDRTIGGISSLGGLSSNSYLDTIEQTSDGGYILGGGSNAEMNGDKTQASYGDFDYWLVKLDANGTKLWDRTIGGDGTESFHDLQQTRDGGCILGGWSISDISGDKTQAGQGLHDYWVVKLAADPLGTKTATTRPALSAYPNPARTQLTLRGPLGTPYQLLNQLGQVVHAGQLTAQPLDVQALPDGLYLLRDQTSGRTTKLVKK